MKKLILFLLILLWVGSAYPVDYSSDVNCQIAYLFKEGSGTTVDDASQNSNTGFFKSDGHPAWSSTVPKTYTSYSVDYSSAAPDWIGIVDSASLHSTGNMAYVSWVNIDASTSDYQTLFSLRCSNNGAYAINALVDQTQHPYFAIVHTEGGAHQHDITDEDALSLDTWYHYAAVWDGTNIIIYINGTNVKSANVGSGTIRDSAADSYIGIYYNGVTIFYKLEGSLVENGYFDRTLSSTEVNDIMDNGLKPAAGVTDFSQVIMVF